MYNEEEIEFALNYRSQSALAAKMQRDEADLLSDIRYTTYKDEVVKPGNQQYRGLFLQALSQHHIYVDSPDRSDDGKWHFYLPAIKEATNEESIS